ncbi:N-acetylglutamate synthase-like GNAT family acetyltransferase [Aquimarina sp. MAR_2010_214]|uniref:GNAT family N-acetyltransferase n=1 Tax=Aquimarina sp. MAR_2010_214 TaxID=1250026 RepID=UPI000C70B914|nr:GNAT family N-acetyltransferase [Aquimarina sp. MAR_2010_214]PKV51547.1 N-acetylglutamate synthase-like GNAT family acetyltransferase [Aquimarina sp. MAR_2010_214]
MIKIVPYNKLHQSDIDEMMNEIASEFDEQIFPKPTNETPITPDRYWVALNNKKVIGTVGVIVIKKEFGVLKKMMLKKTFRGKGLGISKLLLETVINWCEQNDIPKIYLGTMNQFKAAQVFYKKNGFNRISENELPSNFLNNPLDKVFFEQNLNNLN